LKEYQTKSDLPALAGVAHAIKGMAGHFCAESIVNLAKEIEDAARSGKVVDYQGLTESLTQIATKLIDELKLKVG
jgi:HPt (histidine-containing phosphotransfer) domain-containing protein